MALTSPEPLLSERQTGGPEVANSYAPKARGLGYGATGPMVNRRSTRTPCEGPRPVQLELFEADQQGLGVRPTGKRSAARGRAQRGLDLSLRHFGK